MHCSFWEFGAIVRHEKRRHEAGLVSAAEARRTFEVPSFLTSRDSGLWSPADPRAVVADAEAAVRGHGWIERDGQLNDEWYEIVSTLAYGATYQYLYVAEPGAAEIRAMVATSSTAGLAFRFVLHADQVWIEEVRPESAERALVACLPDATVAAGSGVTVPTRTLHAAGVAAEQHEAEQGAAIARALGEDGVPEQQARAVGELSKLDDRVTGHINLGIRVGIGESALAPWAVTTHHSESGRVAQIPQLPDGASTLVTPVSNELLAEWLRTYRVEWYQQLVD